jgi:hypothetical protein
MKSFFMGLVLFSVGVSAVAFADMQVDPKGQDGWGDPGEANKMLQMTKDPDVVHTPTEEELSHRVPKHSASDCMDSAGNVMDGQGCSIPSERSSSGSGPAATPLAQPTPRSRLDGSPSSNANQGFTLTQ